MAIGFLDLSGGDGVIADLFDVVPSELFREGCSALGITWDTEPSMRAVVWALERRPDFYPKVPGTQLRRIIVPPMPRQPRFRIWYRFPVEGKVVLEHIEAAKEWGEEEGYYS